MSVHAVAPRSTGGDAAAVGDMVPNKVVCGLCEVLAVWAGIAVVVLLMFVTYARIPVDELYHVSRGGAAGGASRVLVQLNFPMALIALAIAGVVALRQRQAGGGSPLWSAMTILAVVCCLLVAKPGVVDQDNLDAKWINVVPAAGTIAILILTLISARQHGVGTFGPFEPADRFRLALAIPLVLVSLPWLFALAGVYIGRVPLLGHIFYSEQTPAGESEVAVHLGDHHGGSGLYFALSALLLSRVLHVTAISKLRTALALYLALMLVYGIGNMANDFWTEQIWKRGWTSAQFPNLLQPALTVAWGLLIAVTVMVFLLWFNRIESADSARSSTPSAHDSGVARSTLPPMA